MTRINFLGTLRALILVSMTAIATASLSSAAQAVDAFPGAKGFGKISTGARSPQARVLYITNLNDNGSGSLRACLTSAGPRYCIPKVAGTVSLTSGPIVITNGQLHFAGQARPLLVRINPSVGAGNALTPIEIRASNVVIRHLSIMPGHFASWNTTRGSRSGIGIRPNGATDIPTGIVLDHLYISESADQTAYIYKAGQDITFSNLFSERPAASIYNGRRHDYGPLIGDDSGAQSAIDRVTIVDSIFASQWWRSAAWVGGNASNYEQINTIVSNFGQLALQVGDDQGATKMNIVGNIFEPGPMTPSNLKIAIREDDQNLSVRPTVFAPTTGSQKNWLLNATSLCKQAESSTTACTAGLFSKSLVAPLSSSVSAADNVLKNRLVRTVGQFPRHARATQGAAYVSNVQTAPSVNDEYSTTADFPQVSGRSNFVDTDGDGVSDDYEKQVLASNPDRYDSNAIVTSSPATCVGYSRIECWLSYLSDQVTPK